VKTIMNSFFASQVQILLQKWNVRFQQSENENMIEVELKKDIFPLSLDIIGESAFGYDIQCQKIPENKNIPYKSVITLADTSGFLAFPILKYFFIPQFITAIQNLNYLIDNVLRDFDPLEAPNNLLALMKQAQKLDDSEVRDETFGFLIAGSETTSSGITWTLTSLAENQDVQQKVREEVDQIVGTHEPTYDDLQKMPYLKAVVLESLRLYPPVEFVNRTSLKDQVILDSMIPTGTTVFFTPFLVNRHPKSWENSLQFDPSRYENLEPGKEPPASTWSSFGAGNRMCIGRFLAIAEIMTTVTMVCQKFILSKKEGANYHQYRKVTVALLPIKPIEVIVKKRIFS